MDQVRSGDVRVVERHHGHQRKQHLPRQPLGLIYRWNGTALVNVPIASSTSINSLWSDGTSVFAGGDIRYPTLGDPTKREGMLLKWDGTTFSRITNTPKVHIYGLWGATGGKVFAGAAGTMGSFDGTTFVTNSVLEDRPATTARSTACRLAAKVM